LKLLVFACLETAVMYRGSVTAHSHMNENSDYKTSIEPNRCMTDVGLCLLARSMTPFL
jgi:hypothetical protein